MMREEGNKDEKVSILFGDRVLDWEVGWAG